MNPKPPKPLTLYVHSFVFRPSIEDTFQEAIRAVDIEIENRADARALRDELTNYLDNVTVGSFRFRSIGRMVQ